MSDDQLTEGVGFCPVLTLEEKRSEVARIIERTNGLQCELVVLEDRSIIGRWTRKPEDMSAGEALRRLMDFINAARDPSVGWNQALADLDRKDAEIARLSAAAASLASELLTLWRVGSWRTLHHDAVRDHCATAVKNVDIRFGTDFGAEVRGAE